MKRCPFLKYGFDIEGHTIMICSCTEPNTCPRKYNKPPEHPISQLCWKVEIE